MVQNTGSYKPSQLIVVLSHPTLKATHVVTGFMQDSIVSIERDNATWEHFVGADGFTSRTHNIDKSAKATLSLQNGSYSNDVLQQFLNFDENGITVGRRGRVVRYKYFKKHDKCKTKG